VLQSLPLQRNIILSVLPSQQHLPCLYPSTVSASYSFFLIVWSYPKPWHLDHAYKISITNILITISCKHFIIVQTQEEIFTNQHNTYLCSSWIYVHVVVSLTCLTIFLDIPIVCMIKINILQKLSKSPLPCGHSPSRPRLMHPLLCYIVPRVIHLALPGISRTRRISKTSSSLIVEVSLRLSLAEASLRPMLPQHNILWGSWLITRFSCHYTSPLSMLSIFDIHHLSSLDRSFISHVSHSYRNS
jgi:hypothetical protein